MNFDVIIIGGGAAGLSAALWCADLGLNALVLEAEKEFGGQLLRTYNPIENHLGGTAENGRQLRDIFLKQIENRRFIKRLQAKVEDLDVREKTVFLESGESFSAGALIIATGVRRRKLNIEGEDSFSGSGMLRSGNLDKASVAGKSVVIAGGGDAALENVVILSETAAQVFLVHRRRRFRARPEFIRQAQETGNVKILLETALTKISGSDKIEAVELENLQTDERRILPVEAVLIRIGVEPNTDFLRGKLDLDKDGYVKTDNSGAASVKGIYAVGDVSNPSAPTISSAVGMGATAVKAISSWLNG